MSETKPLLIEIGCEELPPKALDELAASLTTELIGGLQSRGIDADWQNVRKYCSPRRLAMYLPNVYTQQPSRKSETLGPYLNIGLDEKGEPTPALRGFATKNGLTVEQLHRISDAKGERFVARSEKLGQPTAKLIPEILAEALKALPIPKPMRWGDHDFAFVRPMHWLVVLHGGNVVDVEIFGVKSGRESRGHRFHHPQPVEIKAPDTYVDALRSAKVLCDPQERRARVREQVEAAAKGIGEPRLRDSLLNEIANLTEWPVAIACEFERAFLEVPQEALIQTMETNQKFVPVFDAKGKLTEHFIGVANIESKNPSEIRKGYERVIRPRFADAKFFYDEDLKTPLSSHQESLKTVTYQQQLGSVWDKCIRVAELSRVIGNRLGVDAALATRAASLGKCDLMTRMVGEFPELQGVMGRYYATANGENADVARALDEFYRPRFAGDEIAHGKVAQVLAIAERLDTLAGIFAVGMKPSGNKDPFALRRAALGLGRTLIEGNLDLDLKASLREAIELLPPIAPQKRKDGAPEKSASESKQSLTQELLDFVFERLRGYYAEKNIGSDQFDAVRDVEPESLTDFDARLRAVSDFASLPDAAALAASNKRIGNILRQAGDAAGNKVDPALLDAGAENALHDHIEKARDAIAPLLEQRKYVETLRTLAALRAPVDAFFDDVMVMVDDEAKRRNRIALLSGLRRMFLRVADISVLQPA
jgi:glycyl-tRNA synthetase beta chain